MSSLTRKDLHTPLSNASLTKVMGAIRRAKSEQAAAATDTAAAFPGLTPVVDAGAVTDLFFVAAAAAATGESMVVDVLVNGSSILDSTFTFDDTLDAGVQYKLTLATMPDALGRGGPTLQVGDVVTITRTYTAGGSPSMTATSVVLESAVTS